MHTVCLKLNIYVLQKKITFPLFSFLSVGKWLRARVKLEIKKYYLELQLTTIFIFWRFVFDKSIKCMMKKVQQEVFCQTNSRKLKMM